MTSPQHGYRPPAPQPPPPPGPPAAEPWTRSSTDRVVAGVCGGLGRRLGVDPVILRVVVVVLAFFGGAGLLLYAAAWLFMPLDRTNQSVLSDALGSNSTDRTRGVLTAAALVAVFVISAAFAFDGGIVPGLLIAIVAIAVLLVVRRDEAAGVAGRPPYQPPGFTPTYGATTYGQPPYGNPAYGAPTYGEAQYGNPAYAAPASPLAATTPSPYPSTSAPTEPAAATDSSTEPTVITDTGAEATAVIEEPRASGGSGVDPTVTMASPGSAYIPSPSMAPSWIPPIDSPPPSYLSGQAPRPVPRRERSYLGVLTVSAMIAVLGVMGIIDLAGAAVPLAGYVVGALAVVAAGLVLGAWLGRSRGLIALGVVLGLAIGPAVLVDAVAGTEWGDWNNADNVRLAPQTADDLAPVYDYGAGSIRLDLTELDFEGEELATVIDMGAGEVIVTVPADVDVFVDGAITAGELTLFDRRTSGFDPSDAFTDLGADGVGGGRLDLSIDLGLGKVEVRREAS